MDASNGLVEFQTSKIYYRYLYLQVARRPEVSEPMVCCH